MFEKNPGFVLVLFVCTLLAGGVVGYVAHAPVDPKIEWKASLKYPFFELYVNGKPHSFPDHIKLPTKDDGKKKKSGDLPGGAGELGPAAMLLDSVETSSCGEFCVCSPCHCHAAKLISFLSGEDEPVIVGQRDGRGGSQKPELFGLDTLTAVLTKFHESLFGTGNKPGLRDDIANGLRDFYGTVRTGVIVTGVCVVCWMVAVIVCLHRIAENTKA